MNAGATAKSVLTCSMDRTLSNRSVDYACESEGTHTHEDGKREVERTTPTIASSESFGATFDYDRAFSRNIGWVTREEQLILRTKRVAIAGLGGVGGAHLAALLRLGIEDFHIADFDCFELANFNRQYGATVSSIGQPKVEVLRSIAKDINPAARVATFCAGLTSDNIEAFLSGVDLFVDGLDFFALAARRTVFSACRHHGIPATTAAPLGMGVALVNFIPGKMSFEDYFGLEGHSEEEQLVRFLSGLSPTLQQAAYLADRSAVDFRTRRVPSMGAACTMCSGVVATEALKILLNRTGVRCAPVAMHFDAYRQATKVTWRPFGHRHPLQALARAVLKKTLAAETPLVRTVLDTKTVAESIADRARWAPSGDNTQPWRFEFVSPTHLVVHGFDTRRTVVYDRQGHASHLAVGALLENMAIAASERNHSIDVVPRANASTTCDVYFTQTKGVRPDPLMPFVETRRVERGPMRSRPLSTRETEELATSVGPKFRLVCLTGRAMRLQVAWLLFRSAYLRLTLPETYAVHKRVIEWGATYSEDRIPERSIGASLLLRKLMRWGLEKWSRVRFLNKLPFGTLLPRLELDVLPALACASHLVLVAKTPPRDSCDYVDAGRAMQRLWLTATKLGLGVQPEMTPLIFARYGLAGERFSSAPHATAVAEEVAQRLRRLIGPQNLEGAVFVARIGEPRRRSAARSTRKSLEALTIAQRPRDETFDVQHAELA